ncbi:MAG TPA: hypothetical protein VIY72_17755 [Acidimicrobiales bacterium]
MAPSPADDTVPAVAHPRAGRRRLVVVLLVVGALLVTAMAPATAEETDAPTGVVAPAFDPFAGGSDTSAGDVLITTAPDGMVTHAVGDDFAGEPSDGGHRSAPLLAPSAVDEGYTLLDDSVASADNFVIRIAPEVGPSSIAALHAATDIIEAETDTEFTYEAWTDTQETGVITVEVSDSSPCGTGNWLGCGGFNSLGGVIVAGFIILKPSVETDPGVREIVFHELGHVMGLGHFDTQFEGHYQVMRSIGYGTTTTYQSGDLNGIRHTMSAALPVSHEAIGVVEGAEPRPGGARLTGWALDPDTTSSINVLVYVDGMEFGAFPTSVDRPDVNAIYDTTGTHGFDIIVTAAARPEPHEVCLVAVNVGPGTPSTIGCGEIQVGGSPVGSLDTVTVSGTQVVAKGWAIDPDVAGPIKVRLQIDGKTVGTVTANRSRPDVGAVFPGWGNEHGWQANYRANTGTHQLCAYAVDTGLGSDALLACRSFTIGNRSPVGAVESVKGGVRSFRVIGWAVDPDTKDPIQVRVSVDGRTVATRTTSVLRTDVNTARNTTGNHGYNLGIYIAPGSHRVCVYGLNVSYGIGDTLLGCRTFQVLP